MTLLGSSLLWVFFFVSVSSSVVSCVLLLAAGPSSCPPRLVSAGRFVSRRRSLLLCVRCSLCVLLLLLRSPRINCVLRPRAVPVRSLLFVVRGGRKTSLLFVGLLLWNSKINGGSSRRREQGGFSKRGVAKGGGRRSKQAGRAAGVGGGMQEGRRECHHEVRKERKQARKQRSGKSRADFADFAGFVELGREINHQKELVQLSCMTRAWSQGRRVLWMQKVGCSKRISW